MSKNTSTTLTVVDEADETRVLFSMEDGSGDIQNRIVIKPNKEKITAQYLHVNGPGVNPYSKWIDIEDFDRTHLGFLKALNNICENVHHLYIELGTDDIFG